MSRHVLDPVQTGHQSSESIPSFPAGPGHWKPSPGCSSCACLTAHPADGINFDHEDPLPPGSSGAAAYTALVSETAAAFHTTIPGSTIRHAAAACTWR
jgi:hypothetical protein